MSVLARYGKWKNRFTTDKLYPKANNNLKLSRKWSSQKTLVFMNISIREQSNKFKLGIMPPAVESADHPYAIKPKKVGRSSVGTIPTPDPSVIYNPKPVAKKKIPVEVPKESEKLCKELCSSYKFVVNYGVFEPNFEWLPSEVRKANCDLDGRLFSRLIKGSESWKKKKLWKVKEKIWNGEKFS